MTDLGVLQQGRLRRSAREAKRRRLRRRRLLAVAAGLAALVALVIATSWGAGERAKPRPAGHPRPTTTLAARPTAHAPAGYTLSFAPAALGVSFKADALRSGLLFDVRSGRVLWAVNPDQEVPIASLTKMMTALVVAEHSRPGESVMITRQAIQFSGSGVGLLPLGKRVPLEALLYGLLLPSGNDAAIALAQHVAGTQSGFIAMMNARAQALGLRCTHFATVSGIVDQDNYSCASDLAIVAHAVLEQPRLSQIVASRSAILPFPIKGGKLFLYNNNPLLMMRYPGADGVKTGWTVAAGPCLVAAARRGRRWFGVVLLHSMDTPDQAQQLLNAAFARA